MTTLTEVMPAPPKGMVWVLKYNVRYDAFTLWLYRAKWWNPSKSNGWSVECQTLYAEGYTGYVRIDDNIDTIARETLRAADKLLKEVGEEPARKALAEAKVGELSARLGIQVEVK